MLSIAVQAGHSPGRPPRGAFTIAALMADYMTASSPIVTAVKGHMDTGAVILDGPASSDAPRVTGLVTLLQTILGHRKLGRRVRCYAEGTRGGWQEIRP